MDHLLNCIGALSNTSREAVLQVDENTRDWGRKKRGPTVELDLWGRRVRRELI